MEGYHLRRGETVAVEAMVRRKEYFHLRSRPARLFAAAADNEHPSSSITCGWMDGGMKGIYGMKEMKGCNIVSKEE